MNKIFAKALTKISIRPDQYYLIGMLALGIISGSAFMLVSFTIPYQLSQAGHPTTIVGSFFLAALPYSLKPIWAPFIDNYAIPVLCKKFGQRRGWALVAQLLLLFSTAGFLIVDPLNDLVITGCLAFIISFCAATHDIILDAYRIERSKTKGELAISATCAGIGFRLGLLISSIGALYLSQIFNWRFVYYFITSLTIIGPLIILYIKEPTLKNYRQLSTNIISLKKYFQIIKESVAMLKQHQPNWKLIMLFILFYKASDAIPMAMSSPLFIDLSFSSIEIASISKAYGLSVMILGAFLGGVLVSKLGVFKGVLICGSVQILSPLMFMILALTGHNIAVFITTITIQNFCCGLGGTALGIYYSGLCNGQFVATQFALIASFSSLVRISLSFLGGVLADYIDWPQFFFINSLFSMLFIVMFLKLHKKS